MLRHARDARHVLLYPSPNLRAIPRGLVGLGRLIKRQIWVGLVLAGAGFGSDARASLLSVRGQARSRTGPAPHHPERLVSLRPRSEAEEWIRTQLLDSKMRKLLAQFENVEAWAADVDVDVDEQ